MLTGECVLSDGVPDSRASGINALGSVIAEVESDDGHIGIGITIGGEREQCFSVPPCLRADTPMRSRARTRVTLLTQMHACATKSKLTTRMYQVSPTEATTSAH